MRIFGSLLFAVLATALAFSLPYWGGGQPDVTATAPAPELALAKRFVQDVRTRNFHDAAAIVEPAYRPTDNAISKGSSACSGTARERRSARRAG